MIPHQRRSIVLVPVLAVVVAATISCGHGGADLSPRAAEPRPPVAEKIPHRLEVHGDVRIDDYYWLRERDDARVIAYLEAENAYTEAVMAPSESLQQTLFEEIRERIPQDDETVPYRLGGYWYYTRYEDGKEYPIHCRRRGSADAPEEVMLDVNRLAEGQSFMSVRGREVSPDGSLLAYATDDVGRRIYTLRFRDLSTGEDLPDVIPQVTGDVAWAGDDRTVFYSRQDLETLRAYQVYRHVLGTDPADDELVFQEDDPTYGMGLTTSKSREYLFIVLGHTLRTEVRYLPADDPQGEFRVFVPRQGELEYYVDHAGDRFYVRTNDAGENFRLVSTPLDATGREYWTEVVGHRDDVLLEEFDVFRDHLALVERSDALRHLRVIPWQGEAEHQVAFEEPVYALSLEDNHEYDTTTVRFVYSSLATPLMTWDYEMDSRQRILLKQQEVGGGFEASDYVTERLWAPARDGERIPISLVHRRDFERNGRHPLLLSGYGSYGSSRDPWFQSSIVSLLDRGFAFAIAHVRGGKEMGFRWYEQGRQLRKKNTFYDFIDVAEFLIEDGYTSSDRLFARGGSAGGLLMGAVINLRPELFRGVIAGVPFVDVVTTMLDDGIPLTTFEWDEWGDPRREEYYRYMLSYSPYDQVKAQRYPHLLVTTGLHDSQVQYWEPAKWVAKLRATDTGDHRLMLRTNMDAGHGGASGRYESYRETAFEYAFLLELVPEG